MGSPTFGFDDGFSGGVGDDFDREGFDNKISGFDDAINTSVVEEFFGVTPETPPEHEDKLIKDGNDLIQKDLEDRKKSREYDRQQTTKDRPKVETKVSMSFVDWSGFPGGAIHSGAIDPEKKHSTTSRRASLTHGGAKDDDQRRAVLLKAKRRSSVGPTTSTPDEEPKFRNRRSSFRGGGTTRRPSLEQGSHQRAERRTSTRPSEDKEGTHQGAERRGSAKGNRIRRTSLGAEPVVSSPRMRRPVQAAASSTTLEVNKKAPHGVRRPDRKSDRDPAAKFSLELRNKGMLGKAPSIKTMQW
jgi:hypothetical protein